MMDRRISQPSWPFPSRRDHPAAGPIESTRLCLPQLGREAMAICNQAYSSLPIRLSNGRTLIWQDAGPISPAGELVCRSGLSTFTLASDNLSRLEPRLQGLESSVAAESCTALVEHALAPVLDLIENLTRQSVTCEVFRRIDPFDTPPQATDTTPIRIGFVMPVVGEGEEARGWLRADAAFWRSARFPNVCTSTTLGSLRHAAVPLWLSVRLGNCRLPLAELRAIQPGDALRVTPKPPRDTDGLPVRLMHASGRFGCRARIEEDRLTLETSMDTLIDTSPLPALSTGLADPGFAGSIECELSFELGSMRMTLAEISRLRIGQILRLGVHLQEQPVSILVSGRPIARGELAAVGDELVVVVARTDGLPDV